MRSPRSPYEVLGVPMTASSEDIRAAYRRLIKQTHPDAGGSAALADTVREAYELLRDAKSRQAYDAAALEPPPARRPEPAPSSTEELGDRRTRSRQPQRWLVPALLLGLICLIVGLLVPELGLIYAALGIFLVVALKALVWRGPR